MSESFRSMVFKLLSEDHSVRNVNSRVSQMLQTCLENSYSVTDRTSIHIFTYKYTSIKVQFKLPPLPKFYLSVVSEYSLLSQSSSSSSCHAASTDLPDPLSPPVTIAHRSWLVFKATSCIGTELLYIGSGWSSYLCSSM